MTITHSGIAKTAAAAAAIKAYADKVGAQIQEGKARLEQLEAKAQVKKAQAEIAAIAGLMTARKSLQQKVQDLTTTHQSNVPRAKAEIDADVASFKSAIDELGAKLKAQFAAK
jgi:undecaprenyl pyrophosphate synthase